MCTHAHLRIGMAQVVHNRSSNNFGRRIHCRLRMAPTTRLEFVSNVRSKGKVHKAVFARDGALMRRRGQPRVACGWPIKDFSSVVYVCRSAWGSRCKRCFPNEEMEAIHDDEPIEEPD